MAQCEKIPIVVGITGHRNIVDEDKPELKARVTESLKEIQAMCKGENGNDTPVVMLNAFAQGADMLCAEAAFDLGIDVYAVLPREEKQYIDSFDNEEDRAKLFGYLAKTKRKFVAPDIENNKEWIKNNSHISDSSYEYRQLGIYMAEHSHILIALWDGKPPKEQYGCGTVEVIKFALEHKFLDKEHLFKPGTINDSAVVWIKARRQGGDPEPDITKKWLISTLETGVRQENEYTTTDEPPEYLKNIIAKTVKYNAHVVDVSAKKTKMWSDPGNLDEYRKNIYDHYIKSDVLSYSKNQKMYNKFMLLLAILGTFVAFSFLIYDEAMLPFMIFPCSLALGAILCITLIGRKKAYHKDYIEYRAFAEALRIQFYMSMCLKEKVIVTYVGDLYSWAQKIENVWIDKAIHALTVVSDINDLGLNPSDVFKTWVGEIGSKGGQLGYHTNKIGANKKQAQKYERFSNIFKCAAVAIYFFILVCEIVAFILKANKTDWFWENNIFANISWRNFCAIILGMFAAGSLLFSSYWGKLSFDRKYEDNMIMCEFYSSACARWKDVESHSAREIEKFVKEIARAEIVENGIWCSYVKDNGLEINI